jgi:hypothetical protein
LDPWEIAITNRRIQRRTHHFPDKKEGQSLGQDRESEDRERGDSGRSRVATAREEMGLGRGCRHSCVNVKMACRQETTETKEKVGIHDGISLKYSAAPATCICVV